VNLGPAELLARFSRREPTFLLDVRAAKEFAAWRIEGPAEVTALNAPYTRMLAEVEGDDLPRAIARYVEANLADAIPRGRLVVAVCAKGGTSAFVAEGLRSLGYDAVSLTGGTKAWGDWYDVRAVVDEPDLAVLQIARPARGCLSWIAVSGDAAVVIDPLRHLERYHEVVAARGARIVAVIDTHAHADHVSGGRALADAVGAPYRLHPYDAIHPIDLVPARIPYEPLTEGVRVPFGASVLEALHVPGHTIGALALRLDGRFLFAGDTLFVASIARPDLGGRAEAWTPLHHASLRRLLDLPRETIVFPGHFSSPAEADDGGAYVTSIADLRAGNDGARRALGDLDPFARYILASLPEFPPQYVEIKRLNLGLADAVDDRAAELELGKNVCALAAPA